MSRSREVISSLVPSLILLPAILLSTAGCEDPAADKPKATVSTASTAATGAPNVAGDAFPIDAKSSSIGFTGSKVTGSHSGVFNTFTGSVKLAGDKPEGGSVNVEIDMASVKSDSEQLDGHLKNADFFDVAKYPKATFASTEVKAGGEKGATHTITGNLTLHGVTKSITVPAIINVSGDVITATSEFSINRKDFGIVYAGKADDLIRDDVVLKLSLKAPRKKG